MNCDLAQVKRRLIDRLLQAGIERSEAVREVDLIVEHVTGWSTARQIAANTSELSSAHMDSIEKIIAQRERRFPLQYILGEGWFMGLPFAGKPGVLIPRPETELLVEIVLKLIKPLSAPTLMDIGSGSGAISIALLKNLPAAFVHAVEISPEAAEATATNARTHNVDQRLHIHRCDWTDFSTDVVFDCIASNPPYIPRTTAPELQPEVRLFEPELALFGADDDGLGFYRLLSLTAAKHLKVGGSLVVEVGQGQMPSVMQTFQAAGWIDITATSDLNGVPRVMSAFRPN